MTDSRDNPGAGPTRRRWILGGLLALLAIAAVAAVAVIRTDEAGSGLAPGTELGGGLPARPAHSFADSVGVNVHLTYYDTAYARFEEWSALLEELGVTHIRDGLVPNDPRYVERMRELASRGFRASLITSPDEGPPDAPIAAAAGPLRPVVETIEAPNEPDLDPEWESSLRPYMPELRRAMDARLPDVPLLAPSFVSNDSRAVAEDISSQAELENVHPYPGGEQPLPIEGLPAAPDGLMATETGYHDATAATEGQPPVSEGAAAVYLPRLLAENFAQGIPRTFLYELLDEKPDPEKVDAEQHFGLLRQDLSRKPSFVAIRDMLRFVADSPGEGVRRDVRIVDDTDESLGRLLLERRDGSRVLMLWRRAPVWDTDGRRPVEQPPRPVRLRFGGRAEDIEVSYPSRGVEPSTEPSSSSLRLLVGADVVAVGFR